MPPIFSPELLEMLGLGAALGFLGGLFGIGGGIIVIPLLVLGCGLDQAVAQGKALAMMVANLLIGWCRCNCWPTTLVTAAGTIAAIEIERIFLQ